MLSYVLTIWQWCCAQHLHRIFPGGAGKVIVTPLVIMNVATLKQLPFLSYRHHKVAVENIKRGFEVILLETLDYVAKLYQRK
jgi:hypothetical protein